MAHPQSVTGKRKRGADSACATIHVTVGSYERVLHGFAASIYPSDENAAPDHAGFTDLFLLNAHASSIRCVALSPPSNSKRILATGSSDERINLYQLSVTAPASQPTASSSASKSAKHAPLLLAPSTADVPSQRNRELGNLLHHSSTVTTLVFPSYSKLVTASLDNSISIVRTRDWTHLATMRAPAPKPRGRPDGDTAGPGETPMGVADVAVHPSQRLAVSVGLGERCMRLWNLVGGKKAGVLVFDKKLLERVGEPRKSIRAGEARRIVWRPDGQEFAVAFEKGVAVFGLDCRPRAVIELSGREKVGQIRYLPVTHHDEATGAGPSDSSRAIAVSTEAGDLLLFADDATAEHGSDAGEDAVRTLKLAGRVQSPIASGARCRIKDFQALAVDGRPHECYIVAGSSDGAVRVWSLDTTTLLRRESNTKGRSQPNGETNGSSDTMKDAAPRVGMLLGSYETGKRITCLAAFVMEPPAESAKAAKHRAGQNAGLKAEPGSDEMHGEVYNESSSGSEGGEEEEDGSVSDAEQDDEEDDEEEFGGFDDR